LDISSLVYDTIMEKNSDIPSWITGKASAIQNLYWKLVICTPSSIYHGSENETISVSEQQVESLNKFASLWTRSKFGAGGDGSGDGNEQRDVVVDENGNRVTELLRISTDVSAQGESVKRVKKRRKKLSIVVSHIDIQGDAIYPLKVLQNHSIFHYINQCNLAQL
jgi:hypothetical protein